MWKQVEDIQVEEYKLQKEITTKQRKTQYCCNEKDMKPKEDKELKTKRLSRLFSE